MEDYHDALSPNKHGLDAFASAKGKQYDVLVSEHFPIGDWSTTELMKAAINARLKLGGTFIQKNLWHWNCAGLRRYILLSKEFVKTHDNGRIAAYMRVPYENKRAATEAPINPYSTNRTTQEGPPPVQHHAKPSQIAGMAHSTSYFQGHDVDEGEALDTLLQRSRDAQVQHHAQPSQISGMAHSTSYYQGHDVDEGEALETLLQRSRDAQNEEAFSRRQTNTLGMADAPDDVGEVLFDRLSLDEIELMHHVRAGIRPREAFRQHRNGVVHTRHGAL